MTDAQLRARRTKAIARFRPRKSDQQHFVRIDERGKRVTDRRRKAFLVYVTRTKRKTFVSNPSLSPAQNLRMQRASSHRYAHVNKYKTAQKKHFATHKRLSLRYVLRPTATERGNIDWERVVRHVGRTLQSVTSSRMGGVYAVRMDLTVKESTGKARAYSVTVAFQRARGQKMTPADFKAFVRKAVYAFFAEQLSRAGLVSQGSARYVRRLPGNWNTERKNWGKDGQPWEKWDFKEVKLARVEYQVDQQHIRIG